MEPTTGIEPVNLFLTKEVLYLLSYVGVIGKRLLPFGAGTDRRSAGKPFDIYGAGNGTRTRDVQLGRLTLYQLSYSRNFLPEHSSKSGWWRGEDLNLRSLRQQIYSLPPLATREPLHPGAGDGTRTRNLLITNQLLYRLSYASKRLLYKTVFSTSYQEPCQVLFPRGCSIIHKPDTTIPQGQNSRQSRPPPPSGPPGAVSCKQKRTPRKSRCSVSGPGPPAESNRPHPPPPGG
jgi:hypothetical protein